MRNPSLSLRASVYSRLIKLSFFFLPPSLALCVLHHCSPCSSAPFLPADPLAPPDARGPPAGAVPTSSSTNTRVQTTATATSWKELDAKFRRDLPDEAYVGRLAYRGLVMRACPGIRMLDGVEASAKEREKAEGLLRSVVEARRGRQAPAPAQTTGQGRGQTTAYTLGQGQGQGRAGRGQAHVVQ